MKEPTTYILASRKRGTLYIGVTSNLRQRIQQHKSDVFAGFTKQYQVHTLVHVERFATMIEAIAWEKWLKQWERAWKIALIEKDNPDWRDLYADLW